MLESVINIVTDTQILINIYLLLTRKTACLLSYMQLFQIVHLFYFYFVYLFIYCNVMTSVLVSSTKIKLINSKGAYIPTESSRVQSSPVRL